MKSIIDKIFTTKEAAIEQLSINEKIYNKILDGSYMKYWLIKKLVADYNVKPSEIFNFQNIENDQSKK